MANLTFTEKQTIEKLLNMENGYVSDFSNRTIQLFIGDYFNIDIYDDKYCDNGDSKAKRLRTLFNKECYQMEVTALVMHPTMTIYSENSKYYSLSIMVMCYNTCMQVIEYNHLDSIIVEEDRDMFFKQIKEYKTFLINSYTEEMIHSLSNLDTKRVDIF